MGTNPTPIAHLVFTRAGAVVKIVQADPEGYKGKDLAPSDRVVELTEDHIDELLQINQAYYKEWLKKALTNFPIL